MLQCLIEIVRLRKGDDRTEVTITPRHVVLVFPAALNCSVCYQFIQMNAEQMARYELKMAGVKDVMSVRPDSNVFGETAMKIVYVTASTKLDELYRVKLQVA